MTASRSPTFWIVDDSMADRIIFKESLTRLGEKPQLKEIEDGELLLAELDAQYRNELPDIIFLDINMRRMDGKTALEFIRKNKRYDHIYIVMHTGTYREQSECKALGADAFISKSTDFNACLAKLAQTLSTWQTAA